MTDGEQADVDADVLHLVKEEDDAKQEQQMVVAGDHMLGPQIHERDQLHAADLLDIALITFGDGVGKGRGHEGE